MSYLPSPPSPATKSGRPLKPDAIPGAIVDYLNAYRMLKQLQGYSTGGWRGSGNNSQLDSSGNCGVHSLWWWGQDILDIGTPGGAQTGAMGNPAPLIDMLHKIYPNYNIIFDKGYCYYVEAKNNVAQGQRKPVPCSVFNHGLSHGMGFAVGTPTPGSQISQENIQKKLAYRKLQMLAYWAKDELKDLLYTGGFARGGGGGGASYGGQRVIHATIGGKSQSIFIDSGTDTILGTSGGTKQCTFDPNPQSISVPEVNQQQGPLFFTPVSYISQRLKICLTNDYTICQSYGQGGTISYTVQSGQKTQGDIMHGAEWGEANVQSLPITQQRPGAPNYTQPLHTQPNQNQYFPNKKNQGFFGYHWSRNYSIER